MANLKVQFKFKKNNEMHQRAQHYIETIDRGAFPDFSDAMATIIVDYFERSDHSSVAEEPGTEDLDERIEKAVERVLERKMPGMLSEALKEVALTGDESSEEEDRSGSSGEAGKEDDTLDLSKVAENISWGFLEG